MTFIVAMFLLLYCCNDNISPKILFNLHFTKLFGIELNKLSALYMTDYIQEGELSQCYTENNLSLILLMLKSSEE